MKKKILILTLNDYIIYQPTILNLYDFLSLHFDVTIVSFKPHFATKTKDETRNIIYLKTDFFASEFFQKADFILSKFENWANFFSVQLNYHHLYYNKYLPNVLKKTIKKLAPQAQIVIAVDLATLHLAQRHIGSVHFLSLEIDNRTNKYYSKIDYARIRSVFIQSKIRYEYMFPNVALRTFFVQNAPVFNEKYIKRNTRQDFVWAGAIDRRLAVMDCIDFFDRYPQFRLVLKGGSDRKTDKQIQDKFGHLVRANRINFNREYLPADSFIGFLSTFEIGFCFYSWKLIEKSFNYLTAPSGKLFMCLAAGTPVIACDIPGFTFVREFGAGILIKDYQPETILRAVEQIKTNYQQYSDACYEVAKHFSFDKSVEPYIEFLLNENVQ